MATHAVVLARLITRNKDCGIHSFLVQARPMQSISVDDDRIDITSPCMAADPSCSLVCVQLRSLIDHKPLPGVCTGDIGPKMGFQSVDNGFLRLDHVRIPR